MKPRSTAWILSSAAMLLALISGCPVKEEPVVPDGGDGGAVDAGGAGDGGGLMDGGTDGGPVSGCLEAASSSVPGTETFSDGADTATVAVSGPVCARTFNLSSTASLRDGLPANPRVFSEEAGWPGLSTGHALFDALYALALEEVRENSVASVRDDAYDNGVAIPCAPGGCFETGRLWGFVWTRDTAYAADLALAALDPMRTRNSLEFKLSDLRGGGGPQIVQDTGTGGSYPVSSDRAAWALGAHRLLTFLDGADRQAFIDRAFEAVRNTIEHDRQVVFDPEQGLYLGEQSFLDWREQSYPAWAAEDVVQIQMSAALSTNVTHLQLLELGAWLAGEKGDAALQGQVQGWADSLRGNLDATFFHADLGLFGTFTPGTLDRAPVRHFDLLGTSLAVLAGVGSEAHQKEAVRAYPRLPQGPPVIWPQQKERAIYHNRALWPFVTAYGLRAAKQVRNDAVVGHSIRSLFRGAALNLSNLENLEAVSGAPFVDDGIYSGPVVNSQRQLWSVAGYLSMVHDVIFGLETRPEGIRFAPYLTRELRHSLFAGSDSLVLNHFPYRGGRVTVVVELPPMGAVRSGAYAVGETRLDGVVVAPGTFLGPAELGGDHRLEVVLLDQPESSDTLTLVSDTAEYRRLFAPGTPSVTGITATAGGLELGLQGGGEPGSELAFNVYRDGVRVASGLPGTTTTWMDTGATATSPGHCYTVEAVFLLSGNHSQHARPVCWWGSGFERITTIGAQSFVAVGGTLVNNHGRWHHESWGEPGHTITVSGVTITRTGDHLLQVAYGNGAGPVSTGITCAVKRIEVFDEADGSRVGGGLLVMPHLGDWALWSDSSFVKVSLQAQHSYRFLISHDATSLNMSDLEHNARYTAGSGGSQGAFHFVNLSDLKLLSLVE